jgi:hypothetical protein
MNYLNSAMLYKSKLILLVVLSLSITSLKSQQTDTLYTPKDSVGDYPYVFPILGKKSYAKGYKLPKPHGIMVNGLTNKQGIILNDFQMDFTAIGGSPDFNRLQSLSDLVVFGPSEGIINTLNIRVDTWILPFLSVAGYYGRVQGEQTITLTSPINLNSTTDINGQYYGLNLLLVAPLGPVNLSLDYSASWTTNDRLDEAVRVDVSGIRLIKVFNNKKNPEKNFAFWGGAQFQNLADETSGKIDLAEALNLSGNEAAELDQKWQDYKTTPEWDALGPGEKAKAEAQYQIVKGVVEQVGETTVHYRFKKRLEYEWNMIVGTQYQFNDSWQARAEYGFLKSKRQLLISLNYRFGL